MTTATKTDEVKTLPPSMARPMMPSFNTADEADAWLVETEGYVRFGVKGDSFCRYLPASAVFEETTHKEVVITMLPPDNEHEQPWPSVIIGWKQLPRTESEKKNSLPARQELAVVEQVVVTKPMEPMVLGEAVRHALENRAGKIRRAAKEEKLARDRAKALEPGEVLKAKERFLATRGQAL
jgi:hypothetical protein